jgi:hypothetical protein
VLSQETQREASINQGEGPIQLPHQIGGLNLPTDQAPSIGYSFGSNLLHNFVKILVSSLDRRRQIVSVLVIVIDLLRDVVQLADHVRSNPHGDKAAREVIGPGVDQLKNLAM